MMKIINKKGFMILGVFELIINEVRYLVVFNSPILLDTAPLFVFILRMHA